MAYRHKNAARYLMVKGSCDYIADRGGIRATIESPSVPALEPIGGTGDTVTGIASALIDYGIEIPVAAEMAARINRIAGHLTMPTPATQVTAVIACIGRAVAEVIQL